MPIPTYSALRYVTPLREGGSLPALVETDGGMVVVKFRGAGQGARALIAEIIVGGLARRLGLPLPEVSIVELADGFGRAEPDEEIQDILKWSIGLNVGMDFVPGAFAYDPVAHADLIDPDLAADIVGLDALTTNIDRTARNPNLLVARAASGQAAPQLWLIDHGAALYFHHDWEQMTDERARAAFPAIRDHVLLPVASNLADADARLAVRLGAETLRSVLDEIPDSLLLAAPTGREPDFETAEQGRDAYAAFFRQRLVAPRAWAEAAEHARAEAPDTSALAYRR